MMHCDDFHISYLGNLEYQQMERDVDYVSEWRQVVKRIQKNVFNGLRRCTRGNIEEWIEGGVDFGQGGIQMCWVRSRKSRCFYFLGSNTRAEPCRSCTVQSLDMQTLFYQYSNAQGNRSRKSYEVSERMVLRTLVGPQI